MIGTALLCVMSLVLFLCYAVVEASRKEWFPMIQSLLGVAGSICFLKAAICLIVIH